MNLFDRFAGRSRAPGEGGESQKGGCVPLLASLLTMGWFVEARDPYTGGPEADTALISRMVIETAHALPSLEALAREPVAARQAR